MRYFINFDKTINQLVPYYIGGRKLILYLQALMFPLRRVNDGFVEYAKETRIEAAMTSQIFKFDGTSIVNSKSILRMVGELRLKTLKH